VVTYVDEQGETIVTAEITIDSTVLKPGETSSFTVLTDQLTAKPASASATFRTTDGTVVEAAAEEEDS
jgi:hypothetical protein